jgi:surface polysaccharide O-acyltransferase-like enzyme
MSQARSPTADDSEPRPASRLEGIDTMRVIAILAVVTLHFPPWELFRADSRLGIAAFHFLEDCCRFAVPFFFVAAGYFSGRGAIRRDWRPRALGGRVTHLIVLYLFWSTFYVLVWNDWFSKPETQSVVALLSSSLRNAWSESVSHPLWAIFNGPTWHLWFLPALASALVIVGSLQWIGRKRWILPVGAALYAVAVLFGPYRQALGLAPALHDFRNGPFVSTLFVGAGWVWGTQPNWRPRQSVALLLFAIGAAAQYSESSMLVALKISRVHPEYSAATPLLGFGAFLLALASSGLGAGTIIPALGRYTLGVYVLHLFVGMTIRPLFVRGPQFAAFAHAPTTYLLSLALTLLLAKIRPLKPLVM